MSYHGDIPSQQTLYFKFTTNLAGVPATLVGTPVLSVYKDDSTTQATTGLTLVVDFDGVTGLHSVKIATTDAFYATGHDYSVVITTGTVGGVSAVGYVIGSFSIENRSAATPAEVNAEVDTALNTAIPVVDLSDDAIAAIANAIVRGSPGSRSINPNNRPPANR